VWLIATLASLDDFDLDDPPTVVRPMTRIAAVVAYGRSLAEVKKNYSLFRKTPHGA
jgi:hypothetical protein